MNTFTKGTTETHTYRGLLSEINFFKNEDEMLSVTIDTERLHLRSVEKKDEENYSALFADQGVMEKYGDGTVESQEDVAKRIDCWVTRWRSNDPYSGLAIFMTASDEFVGHVILGHGDCPGQSELAGLSMKSYWRNKLGTEGGAAVVKEYAPATVMEGFLLEGKALEVITATARTDNLASIACMEEKFGMRKIGEAVKHGALRYNYELRLNELKDSPSKV